MATGTCIWSAPHLEHVVGTRGHAGDGEKQHGTADARVRKGMAQSTAGPLDFSPIPCWGGKAHDPPDSSSDRAFTRQCGTGATTPGGPGSGRPGGSIGSDALGVRNRASLLTARRTREPSRCPVARAAECPAAAARSATRSNSDDSHSTRCRDGTSSSGARPPAMKISRQWLCWLTMLTRLAAAPPKGMPL
jgi:hypothetical protein